MFCNGCGKELAIPHEPCPNCGALNTSSWPQQTANTSSAIVSHVGLVIDERYRIDSKLGSGGMATVYRATRLLIGDTVAIKILHPDQVRDPQSAERFRREAQAAARLKHPNAVTIHDFGVSADGLIYLVMELVEGKSVRAMIREQGPVTPTTAAEILRQVCAALEEAHKQNIVHRDVKPDNIVVAVTPTGLRVKVLDFGIARMRDIAAANITQTGSVMGTPHYMSPEQCLGEELDSRSDIYSLGVVLFEMLAGIVPFNSPTSSAVIIQHVNQAPPPLRVINISVPPAIEAVVLRALSKRREDRPQSAQLLAEELTDAVAGGSVSRRNADTASSKGDAGQEATSDGSAPTLQMSTPAWSSGPRGAAPSAAVPHAAEPPTAVPDHFGGAPFIAGQADSSMDKRLARKTRSWAAASLTGLAAVVVIAAGGYWWLNRPSEQYKAAHGGATERTGTLAINPQFDEAGAFSEGLAMVRIDDAMTGKYGYIDKTGKMVVTAKFDKADAFSEGLAAVRIGDYKTGRWGYIDRAGKMVITPQFDEPELGGLNAFSEGLAAVRIGGAGTGRWAYIDKIGKMGVTQFDGAGPFSEGLAPVRIGDGAAGRWGYINKAGKMVVTPQFDRTFGFSEGLAPVMIGDFATGRWGYIDKTSKMVVAPQFDWAFGFSEGLALVAIGRDKTTRWGYVDKTGTMVVTPQFDEAGPFSEGLALVRIAGKPGSIFKPDTMGKYGYIDKTGTMVISPQFFGARGQLVIIRGKINVRGADFSEGLASVRTGDEETGRFGYIDKTGKIVVTPQFDGTAGFSEGLAPVKIGGRWGYIYR